MKKIRLVFSYLLSALTTVALASGFYTQQIITKQTALGAVYAIDQQADAFIKNFTGLAPAYGVALAIGLAIAFLAAAIVKRVLRPLAPIAYPVAGAAAVIATVLLIENTAGAGGVGAIGGARNAVGLALQGLAGFIGGVVFAMTRGAQQLNTDEK